MSGNQTKMEIETDKKFEDELGNLEPCSAHRGLAVNQNSEFQSLFSSSGLIHNPQMEAKHILAQL